MRTEFGDELWQLAHAMQRLTIMAKQRPQVTRDYNGTRILCDSCEMLKSFSDDLEEPMPKIGRAR
jgi:hypothetical protein